MINMKRNVAGSACLICKVLSLSSWLGKGKEIPLIETWALAKVTKKATAKIAKKRCGHIVFVNDYVIVKESVFSTSKNPSSIPQSGDEDITLKRPARLHSQEISPLLSFWSLASPTVDKQSNEVALLVGIRMTKFRNCLRESRFTNIL